MNELTYDQWYEKFKPQVDEGGSLINYWPTKDQEIINKMIEKNRLWTVLDCDGVQVIGSGYHHVNRMDYVICEVPFEDGEDYSVVDQEDITAEEFLGKVNDIMEEKYGIDPEDEKYFFEIEDVKHDGILPMIFANQLAHKHKLTSKDEIIQNFRSELNKMDGQREELNNTIEALNDRNINLELMGDLEDAMYNLETLITEVQQENKWI